MKAVCLHFYMYEFQKVHGVLLFHWLLEFANKNGLKGGSAFRAIAGFGRQGMHHEHFFELASNVPIVVTFILKKEEGDHFLDLLKQENLSLFYTLSDVECGFTNASES